MGTSPPSASFVGSFGPTMARITQFRPACNLSAWSNQFINRSPGVRLVRVSRPWAPHFSDFATLPGLSASESRFCCNWLR